MVETTDKKQNAFLTIWTGIVRFFKEIKSEVKKVIWPTPKEIYNGTVITISAIFIIGVFIWVLTWLINKGVVQIIGY